MPKTGLKITLISAVAMVLMQVAFLFMPPASTGFFNQGIRPAVYLILASIVWLALGKDSRPPGNRAFYANIAAFFSVLLYGIIFVLFASRYGGGSNPLTGGFYGIAINIWTVGSVFLLGEYIRYRLMRSADESTAQRVLLLIVISYTFAGLGALRFAVSAQYFDLPGLFFSSILIALAINSVACYLCMEGSFISALIVSGVYSLTPLFFPVFPNVDPTVWSLWASLSLVTIGLFYYRTADRATKAKRRKADRFIKQHRVPVAKFALVWTCAVLLCAFFMRAFPIYPVAVQGNSMAGTINAGSLAIVRKVKTAEASSLMGEIVHFVRASDGREIVHRVVEYGPLAGGDRVFITQGDANPMPDTAPVAPGQIYGIVRAHIPAVAYPYIFLRNLE